MKQPKTLRMKRLKMWEPKRRGRLNTLLLAITLQVQDFMKIIENYKGIWRAYFKL